MNRTIFQDEPAVTCLSRLRYDISYGQTGRCSHLFQTALVPEHWKLVDLVLYFSIKKFLEEP